VVLNLYETSLRKSISDKCKWEITALRKSEYNFFLLVYSIYLPAVVCSELSFANGV